MLNFPPKLDNQILTLLGVVGGAEARPTAGSVARFQDLRAELDELLTELEAVLDGELAAFNELASSKEMPPVILPADW